jgi:hypothetical protein
LSRGLAEFLTSGRGTSVDRGTALVSSNHGKRVDELKSATKNGNRGLFNSLGQPLVKSEMLEGKIAIAQFSQSKESG